MTSDRYHQLCEDRHMIELAAAHLRQRAIAEEYSGVQWPATAFALALALDEAALHLGQLTDEVRAAAVEQSGEIVRSPDRPDPLL